MIKFQYSEGCPNSEQTLKNLQNLIKEKIQTFTNSSNL